jgi:hypothetical protein
MSYQIIDNTASIKFISDNGQFLLMKYAIERVAVVREDIIQVNTGNCSGNISFRHRSVSSPVSANALALVQLINSMLAPLIETPPNR